ncbi:hypothetical protein [Chryseobacterium jejuense]|uniref:Uncharacterized protein n=1 Tax=Chryseobacterium jejuense TaxID=445960 RepID=A0A2X2VEI4_CHRJE|nr:hypothetical protein [Chryseobacterium jejuense]SDI40618.1 hypothetical protein SAMN05421542_1118 [Chryseobacterium jejuense]SQB26978.1 Uncharacterised protein [Chryseobacterium jejuense]
MKTKTFFLTAFALCSFANAQVGINTTTPTSTLDVNGSVRVRGLSNNEQQIVTANADGTFGLLSPEEIFSPKAILNTSTSGVELRATIYEGKCFQPTDNASSCVVSLSHYSSCLGFNTPIETKIVVGQNITPANGQFSGVWSARYIDNKGVTTDVTKPIPQYPIISSAAGTSNYLASSYLGGLQCTADLVTTIDPTTGNIKVESVKRNMFAHLIYLLSVARSRSL